MKSMAILTDVTKCIGCEECVAACDAPTTPGWTPPSAGRTILRVCRPPVGQLWRTLRRADSCGFTAATVSTRAAPQHVRWGLSNRTEEGPIVYDPVICMGCRYCMLACPFRYDSLRVELGDTPCAEVPHVLPEDHATASSISRRAPRMSDRRHDFR